MIGELCLLVILIMSIAYFVYIQAYMSDPYKEEKDQAWLAEWEKLTEERRSRNALRRPSIENFLRDLPC